MSSPSNHQQNNHSLPEQTGTGVSKKATFIIAATTGILTWLASYYSDHTSDYSEFLSQTRTSLTERNSEWTSSALIIELPLGDRKSEIVKNLMATRVAMSSFHTNDAKVDALIASYKNALDAAMGAVNTFDGTEDSLTNMINSLQLASNIGGELGLEISVLNASFKRKFLATLLNGKSKTTQGDGSLS